MSTEGHHERFCQGRNTLKMVSVGPLKINNTVRGLSNLLHEFGADSHFGCRLLTVRDRSEDRAYSQILCSLCLTFNTIKI